MSKFISLLKRKHEQETVSSPSNSVFLPPPLHRKIHPNLDSLLARLEDHHSINVSHRSADSNATDYIPLKPRPPVRGRSNGTALQPEPQAGDHQTAQVAHTLPFGPGDAWSTFGRSMKPPLDARVEDGEILTNHETPSVRRYMHHQTPTSTSRSSEASSPMSQSMQHNRNTPSSRNDTTSTPHTLERRSSPASYYTFGRRPSSSHIVAETPPPLPPLDHPAFQSVIRTRNLPAPSSDAARNDMPERHPRHSVSLPSISSPSQVRSRNASGRSKSIRSAGKKHYEMKASQIDGPNDRGVLCSIDPNGQNRTILGTRTRSWSKSSHGSRQSSAERNIKEAATAKGDKRFWSRVTSEEPGTKRSLPKKDRDISALGKTCGENVPSSGRVLKLGDPFLFQTTDAHSHLAPQPGRHGRETDLPFIHDITKPQNGEGNTYEMNQPDSTARHSNNHQGRVKRTSLDALNQAKPSANRGQKSSPPKQGHASVSATGSLLVPPSLSLTSPTPDTSPISPYLPLQSPKQSTKQVASPRSDLPPPPPALKSSIRRSNGKRKADEVEVEAGTPSKDTRKEHRATFAPERRPHRISENSGSSHAPSSYHNKRARLSTSSELRPLSRSPTMTSQGENLNAGNTGSWSSRGSPPATGPHHRSSRQSMQSQRPSNHSYFQRPSREPSRRRSLSGASIPISALVSPHAPSIARSMTFHMHDPKRPGPIQGTSWALSLPASTAAGSRWTLVEWVERGGSPVHAWLFFLGFIIFPVWWLAAFISIPETRRIGGDAEKGVILDDPQVEQDCRSWRTRCRVMSAISIFTYIPFIILVAIFARH